MLFEKGEKGITLNRQTLELEVVDVVDGDWEAAGVIVHEVTNRSVAHMLIAMPFGDFPMAVGVIYDDPRPTFEAAVVEQNKAVAKGKKADLQALLKKGQTWTVAETGKAP
jgi:2-oxoglutarate ferredoxin oxidoreductase subunit beta